MSAANFVMTVTKVLVRKDVKSRKPFSLSKTFKWYLFRPFLKSFSETFNCDPPTLNQFLFCINSNNTDPKTLHTPLHTFPNFGPPTFRFWFQSAHEIPTRLKMSAGVF